MRSHFSVTVWRRGGELPIVVKSECVAAPKSSVLGTLKATAKFLPQDILIFISLCQTRDTRNLTLACSTLQGQCAREVEHSRGLPRAGQWRTMLRNLEGLGLGGLTDSTAICCGDSAGGGVLFGDRVY